MGRTVRDTNLETPTARSRLTPRRKPYWRVLESGLHLGYRRTQDGGGSWIVRRFVGNGRYSEHKIGVADGLQDADAVALLSFSEAQEAARTWWRREERRLQGLAPDTGPYTVADVLKAYFSDRERRGSKGLAKDRAAAHARILPYLGEIELAKLTTKRIRDWHTGLVTAPKLIRPALDAKSRKTNSVNPQDADAVRARRATANRTLTVLKAALNHTFQDGRTTGDEAWRKVKPFREVDAAVVRFLSADECRRVVNACDGAFRNLVSAALLSGCRYGELTRMRASDFNAQSGTITVREAKSGKPRHVALTEEGQSLFASMTAGRIAHEPIFKRDDSKTWGPSHQQRPLEAACARAKIEPAATFHILRHTYASALAMRGVPMGVIAAQLGHSDTRMTEKHYAHMSPNYVADTVRAALPVLGILEKTSVQSLAGAYRQYHDGGVDG